MNQPINGGPPRDMSPNERKVWLASHNAPPQYVLVICRACGGVIPKDRRLSLRRHKMRRFCCLKCSAAENPPPRPVPRPIHDRFLAFVAKASPMECWLWGGAKDGCGYGLFRTTGRTLKRAHIVAADLAGVGGTGPYVLHTCDNPTCCNPAHLYRGTPLDNARDRDQRCRWKDHWNSTK